jgi:hypothetical protein
MKMMILLTLCVIGALSCLSSGAQAAQMSANNQSLAAQSLSQMPLAFTKNVGQWDDRVLFRARSGGAAMWFTKEGVTYQFTRRIAKLGGSATALGLDFNLRGNDKMSGKGIEPDSIEQLVLTAKFLGGNTNPEVVVEGQMEYKCNYFLGNEPTKWHTDVPNYSAITLKDVYPGINIKYYDGGTGQAAYEFVVAPGADMSQIKVAYEGAEATTLDADGQLVVQTKWGNMTAAIGSSAEGSGLVSPRLTRSSDNTYGIALSGQNHNEAMSSKVGLVYSTYLGGGQVDRGYAIAVNGNGNAYVTGTTLSSDFPTLNPYQTDQPSYDVLVTKLSSSGNSLIYSTYLGGWDDEGGYGIAVDASGNAYVTGWTDSHAFPTTNRYQAYQGGNDVFVAKLSSYGNTLIYSTYLGGGGDDGGNPSTGFGGGIVIDGSGNAYVTGYTASSDFPTLNPYQTDQPGPDAFVTKFSSTGSTLIYSTYLGGADYDWGYGIAVDGSGNAYVTGFTLSSDFPTLNPYQTEPDLFGDDVFVTKLSSSGNSLIYSTYLGGEGDDWGTGIAIDSSGNAYVTGNAGSPDFPTLNPYQTYPDDNSDNAFVTKLSSSGNSLIYSTYLGGGSIDRGEGIAIDDSGNAYVAGYTYSSDFPTLNPYQAAHQGDQDVFVTKLSSSGNSLIYSTYLGGANPDDGRAIVIEGNGDAYVTGEAGSDDFPTLNPYQTYQDGDVFVTKLRYFACTECGDANSDGSVDISDVVFLIAHIFSGGAAPADCNYAKGKGDANGDGSVDISDVVYLIARIFSGGKAPHCQGL